MPGDPTSSDILVIGSGAAGLTAAGIMLLSVVSGAKMGNGLLMTLLGALILWNQGADWITQSVFGLALTTIYILNFIDFLRHPERAVVG